MTEIKDLSGNVKTTIDNDLIFAVFSDMDLSNADFRNARLRYAKFIRCNVEGADFRGADMLAGYISQTDFKKAITDSTTKMPVPPTYSASYM